MLGIVIDELIISILLVTPGIDGMPRSVEDKANDPVVSGYEEDRFDAAVSLVSL